MQQMYETAIVTSNAAMMFSCLCTNHATWRLTADSFHFKGKHKKQFTESNEQIARLMKRKYFKKHLA